MKEQNRLYKEAQIENTSILRGRDMIIQEKDQEINRLESALIDIEQLIEVDNEENVDNTVLFEKNCLIVGGTAKFRENVIKKYPHFRVLSPSDGQIFPDSIFMNVDYVFINVVQLNHPYFKAIKRACRSKKVPYFFLPHQEMGLAEKDMVRYILKAEK